MKAHELRVIGREELLSRIEELQHEIFNLRFRKATQQLDNPLRIRTVRRELARALTVLRETDLGIEAGTDEGSQP
jgi:large subunit ribosomal protein L29